jgi:hypothetical protein
MFAAHQIAPDNLLHFPMPPARYPSVNISVFSFRETNERFHHRHHQDIFSITLHLLSV